MNALAYSVSKKEIIDLYEGQKDIKDKMVIYYMQKIPVTILLITPCCSIILHYLL